MCPGQVCVGGGEEGGRGCVLGKCVCGGGGPGLVGEGVVHPIQICMCAHVHVQPLLLADSHLTLDDQIGQVEELLGKWVMCIERGGILY